MTKSEKKIADLEERVRALEAIQFTLILLTLTPVTHPYQPQPYQPIVTCGGSTR